MSAEDIRFDAPPTAPPDAESWQPGDDAGEVVGQAHDLTPPLPEEIREQVAEPPQSEPPPPIPPPEPGEIAGEIPGEQPTESPNAETDVAASPPRDNGTPGLVSDADADDALEAQHHVERQQEPEPERPTTSADRDYHIALVQPSGTEVWIGQPVTAKNTEGAFRAAAKLKDENGEFVLPDGEHKLVATPVKYRTEKTVACGPRSSERGVRVG